MDEFFGLVNSAVVNHVLIQLLERCPLWEAGNTRVDTLSWPQMPSFSGVSEALEV